MKKEAIVTSILLLSPVSYLQAQDIQAARVSVQQQRQELLDMQFISKNSQRGVFYRQDESGEYVRTELEFRYRLSFLRADNEYTYDGSGGMEYEVNVERLGMDGEVLEMVDFFHYAKRMDENSFKLFDCDSTKTCWDDYQNIVFHIFDTPNGKLLKFKQTSEVGDLDVNFSKEYFQLHD